jgi:hypothetical protein
MMVFPSQEVAMSDKPNLRDRRRTEARDALYRAMERRDRLIDNLSRNTIHIKKLKQTLKRLNVVDDIKVSSLRASVAEGKMLEPLEIEAGIHDDDMPDLTGGA